MSDFRVSRIDPEAAQPLRHKVLWPHIARTEDCVIDIDRREDAIHLGVYDGDRLVSVGSLSRISSPKLKPANQYRLRAMATDPEYRGRHCGAILIKAAIAQLKEMQVEVLWCDARLNATGFYEKLGFSKLDEVYEVPKIGPHKFMWIELQSH